MANHSIGQFIAALRRANGMTQQAVADRLNVSNKAVSRWERDECAPDLSLIPALAELFGVTCDELLKGERIIQNEPRDKAGPKVEKQIKALLNRAVSRFKTVMWVSMALSAMGFVCMRGSTSRRVQHLLQTLRHLGETISAPEHPAHDRAVCGIRHCGSYCGPKAEKNIKATI